MTIDEVKNLISYVVNKEQSTELSPDEIDEIVSMAQRNYISYLLGSFQRYQPGRPISNVQLGNNATVRQRLTPVIFQSDLVIDSTGFASYPDDYLQTDAMWTIYGNVRVRYIEQDRFYSVVNSVIDPPATNPFYLLKDTGFQVYPNDLGQARLSYIRNPANVHWAYTFNIYGQPIYDPINSVQPVFGDLAIFEVIARALQMVGINLQASQIASYGSEIKNTGQ